MPPAVFLLGSDDAGFAAALSEDFEAVDFEAADFGAAVFEAAVFGGADFVSGFFTGCDALAALAPLPLPPPPPPPRLGAAETSAFSANSFTLRKSIKIFAFSRNMHVMFRSKQHMTVLRILIT